MVILALSNMENYSEKMAEGMVESSRYVDSNYEYPSFSSIKGDDGVVAEWFYPAMNSQSDVSELKAILTYTTQNIIHSEIGNVILGVSFVEMQHFDKISELVHKLGGKLQGAPSKIIIDAGKTVEDALNIAISSEQKSIYFYKKLKEKVQKNGTTKTVKTVIAFLDKLIADETVHFELFSKLLQNNEK